MDETERPMDRFISALEKSYGVKIFVFMESTSQERRDGFRIITDKLPFKTDQGDTHFILLLPSIIFQEGPDNRAFFVCGPENTITKIIKRMELKNKMPASERLDDPSGLITEEQFDRMWGKK
jgi:hypothetical protein